MSDHPSSLSWLRRLLQPHASARPFDWPRVLFTVGALVAAFALLLQAIPAMARNWAHFPWDGFIDWGGGREMVNGRDPYSAAGLKAIGLTRGLGLGHPPTALIWFYPLAAFDVTTMKAVFTILTLLMLAFHVGLATRELRFPLWPVVALLVFAAVYQTDWFLLHLDQVDLSEMIAFFYLLCWYFLRRGNDATAGVMAGLACTLKLYPGLLVVFLLVGRRWRAAVGAAAAYLVFAAEAVRRLGLGSFKHFLEQTGSYPDLWMADVRNASIDGIVHRLFYPVWRAFPGGRPVLNRASLLAAVISLALLVAAARLSAPALRRAKSDPTAIDLPFALFSILTIAPGPYQWEHYSVTLILPWLVLLADALWGQWRQRSALRATILLGVLPATALLLNVSFSRRIGLAASVGRTHVWTLRYFFYECSAWLPWFILSVALGARLFVLNRVGAVAPAPGQPAPGSDGPRDRQAGTADGAGPSLRAGGLRAFSRP